MVGLGITLSLDIPVFDRPDDVSLVGCPELQIDLVPALSLIALMPQAWPTSLRLNALPVAQHQLAQPKDRRVFGNQAIDLGFANIG